MTFDMTCEVFKNRSPDWLDARSLALHERIAEKVKVDPSLIDRARSVVESWLTNAHVDKRSHPYMHQWFAILSSDVDRVIQAMLDPSQAGKDLRQASPFAGALSHKERFQFFREWGVK